MKKRYYMSDMLYYDSFLSTNSIRPLTLFAVELKKIEGVSNITNIYLEQGRIGCEFELCFDIEENQLEKITKIAEKVGYYSSPRERTLEQEKANQAKHEFKKMQADEYRRIGIACGLIKL